MYSASHTPRPRTSPASSRGLPRPTIAIRAWRWPSRTGVRVVSPIRRASPRSRRYSPAPIRARPTRPRRQVARRAIEGRVAALHAEHGAKLRDLATRYTLRVRLEPIALAAIGMRVVEIRIRLRRRKGERELTLHVPPGARAPDVLVCVGCPATTRAPLLCDALHILCETCAPEVGGRPRCPACRPGRDPRRSS